MFVEFVEFVEFGHVATSIFDPLQAFTALTQAAAPEGLSRN